MVNLDPSLTQFPDTSKKPKVVDANYDNSKMSREDFLKVLLTDLQFQDPLNAKDISEFIDNTIKLKQMESFDAIQKLADAFSQYSGSLLMASNLIGKTITYSNGNSDQTGQVTGVVMQDNQVMFKVGNDTVSLDKIKEISI
ncbi:MAG: flagellar hook capping FlgD N-terminal domain-containing protein [Hydrogenothermaceae bacterium]